MKKAEIRMYNQTAGYLIHDENGYTFQYDPQHLDKPGAEAISLTLPLQQEPFKSRVLFAFFDGLIPEGWLLEIAEKNWKLSPRDRMSLLLVCCEDCIGAVSVHAVSK